MLRVLVVDDSAFMRRVISDAIAAEPDMAVAGVAVNGLDALIKVEQLQPDVVTLDVEMPEMDGLTALRHLMARYPRPVLMLSSQTQAGATTTLRALGMGAVDFVAKPSGSISLDFHRVREELIQKLRVAAGARITPRLSAPRPQPELPVRRASVAAELRRLVVIGSSTGGPRALTSLLSELKADDRTAYLVVQHMPAGFTRSLAERLNELTDLDVHEAAEGEPLKANQALVAPGDHHLRIDAGGTIRLDQGPRVHGVRPSVDVTLFSAAQSPRVRQLVVAVLTGMGQDGAAGAVAAREAGAYVLAEDASTCVVWGMPRAVVERGAADRVVALDEMPNAIREALGRRVSRLAAVGAVRA
jgi:two-component system, chemotaxis family, protein-glutamate methylesterase/glutaminase